MLKAKLTASTNRLTDRAMEEVSRIDNDKVVFARVTAGEMKKLKMLMLKEDITMAEWVKEKISEII